MEEYEMLNLSKEQIEQLQIAMKKSVEEEAKRILCKTERNLGYVQSGDQNCSKRESLQP